MGAACFCLLFDVDNHFGICYFELAFIQGRKCLRIYSTVLWRVSIW